MPHSPFTDTPAGNSCSPDNTSFNCTDRRTAVLALRYGAISMMSWVDPTTWPSIVMSISLPSSVCEAPSRTTVVLSSNTWNRRVARIMSMNRRLTCRLVKLIFCATSRENSNLSSLESPTPVICVYTRINRASLTSCMRPKSTPDGMRTGPWAIFTGAAASGLLAAAAPAVNPNPRQSITAARPLFMADFRACSWLISGLRFWYLLLRLRRSLRGRLRRGGALSLVFCGLPAAVGIRLVGVNGRHRRNQANHRVAQLHLRVDALAVRENQPRQRARLPFRVLGRRQFLDLADGRDVAAHALILGQQRFRQFLRGRRAHVVIQCVGEGEPGAVGHLQVLFGERLAIFLLQRLVDERARFAGVAQVDVIDEARRFVAKQRIGEVSRFLRPIQCTEDRIRIVDVDGFLALYEPIVVFQRRRLGDQTSVERIRTQLDQRCRLLDVLSGKRQRRKYLVHVLIVSGFDDLLHECHGKSAERGNARHGSQVGARTPHHSRSLRAILGIGGRIAVLQKLYRQILHAEIVRELAQ